MNVMKYDYADVCKNKTFQDTDRMERLFEFVSSFC